MDIVYGGSFNPPTVAHFMIAQRVMTLYSDYDFYFLPTGHAYSKTGLVDDYHRVRMLKLLCRRLGERAHVSIIETLERTFTGTYYSLKHFCDPMFVLGADNLIGIESWVRYPDVIIENKFIVIPRDDINLDCLFKHNLLLSEYQKNFTILDVGNLTISSSQFRNTKDNKYLLPEVAQYIKENNLYKE
ncbi:MAG: nicotinate-nicotinamide nucleotide adenylyltransferase [Bacilli bacterium]|nr:nicotinate-nicotinamide nucleotide adenylyltransferase [Bacilli bacterium]MDD4077664.1 nicotinate-nicotinamide nucleotide adenylyltransferase [Bacilli bacterium]